MVDTVNYFVYPGRHKKTGGVIYNYCFIQHANIPVSNVIQPRVKLQLQFLFARIVFFRIKNRIARHAFYYDIEDVYHLLLSMFLSRLLFKKRVVFVPICHHLDKTQSGDYKLKNYVIQKFSRYVIVPSEFTASLVDVPDHKKIVLNPPLRLISNSTAKNINPTRGKAVNMLYIGSVGTRKNLKYHLNVVSKLPEHYKLTLCTQNIDQEYWQACCERMEQLNITNRVILKSGLTDKALADEMVQSDLFLFLSNLEGFGMVNIEAMAHGLPVVISEIEAHKEITSDGVLGRLVPLGNAQVVADTIQDLMKSPETYHKLSEKGINHSRGFIWSEEKIRSILELA